MVKRFKIFCTEQSCTMFNEMFNSFDEGLKSARNGCLDDAQN